MDNRWLIDAEKLMFWLSNQMGVFNEYFAYESVQKAVKSGAFAPDPIPPAIKPEDKEQVVDELISKRKLLGELSKVGERILQNKRQAEELCAWAWVDDLNVKNALLTEIITLVESNESLSSEPVTSPAIKPGDKVSHKLYGTGIVESIHGDSVIVRINGNRLRCKLVSISCYHD